MSHRTTGNAAIPARSNDKTRLPQNKGSPGPAFMAPGIAHMTALSTISMIAIDAVSEANASPRAVRNATPRDTEAASSAGSRS